MVESYTKLFNTIITSSIWSEDPVTCKVWVTLLALADKNGIVHGTIPGLADMARVEVERCEQALIKFMSPDKYSRTQEYEGRRIVKIDGGYKLINYDLYTYGPNKTKVKYETKGNNTQRKREIPVNDDKNVLFEHTFEGEVDSPSRARGTETETETETEEKKKKKCLKNKKKIPFPPTYEEVKAYQDSDPKLKDIDVDMFFYGFDDAGWIDTQGKPVRNWKLKMRTWTRFRFGEKIPVPQARKKTKLFPIPGRVCSEQGCGLPAVYKSTGGAYDHYKCGNHMPAKVKEEYEW